MQGARKYQLASKPRRKEKTNFGIGSRILTCWRQIDSILDFFVNNTVFLDISGKSLILIEANIIVLAPKVL